jgi:hypothetical protein
MQVVGEGPAVDLHGNIIRTVVEYFMFVVL